MDMIVFENFCHIIIESGPKSWFEGIILPFEYPAVCWMSYERLFSVEILGIFSSAEAV